MITALRAMGTLDDLLAFCFPEPNTGCWLWPSNRRGPTRDVFRKFVGPIPPTRPTPSPRLGITFVLHRCDVEQRVNPDHLYLGDHAQNVKDAVERGRVVKGDRWYSVPGRQGLVRRRNRGAR